MDNPQVIRFVAEGVRPVVTATAALYYSMRQLVADYDATETRKLLGDDMDAVISDGAAADGRPTVTVGGIIRTIENFRGLVAQVEAKPESGPSLIEGAISISPRYQGG